MICIKCGMEKDTAEFIGYPYVGTCRECIIKGAKVARAVNIGAMIFLTLFATLYVFLYFWYGFRGVINMGLE